MALTHRRLSFILPLLLAIAVHLSFGQAVCPSYTHKDNVPEDSAAALPAGFMVFHFDSADSPYTTAGLYKSDIRRFAPALVPGTEADGVISPDISDDGRWAVYVATSCLYGTTPTPYALCVVSLDGGKKAQVPFQPASYRSFPVVAGFVHNGPRGMEVYFFENTTGGAGVMHAISVDVSGDSIAFGNDRLLLDLSNSPRRLWPYGGTIVAAVARDAIFGAFCSYGSAMVYNEYVTIPDSGRGTAVDTDFYHWDSPPDTSLWGCGQSISHDAAYCVTNSGYIGSACVPNKNQDPMMDHKGVYITPFFRPADPPMKINQQADSAAASINWCPARFRLGQYNEVDFNEWSFGNRNDYIIGSLKGALAPVWGLWMVQRKTNTWTLLTPDEKTNIYSEPAVFFTEGIGVRRNTNNAVRNGKRAASFLFVNSRGGRTVAVPAGARYATLYTADGRLVRRMDAADLRDGGRIALRVTTNGGVGIVKLE